MPAAAATARRQDRHARRGGRAARPLRRRWTRPEIDRAGACCTRSPVRRRARLETATERRGMRSCSDCGRRRGRATYTPPRCRPADAVRLSRAPPALPRTRHPRPAPPARAGATWRRRARAECPRACARCRRRQTASASVSRSDRSGRRSSAASTSARPAPHFPARRSSRPGGVRLLPSAGRCRAPQRFCPRCASACQPAACRRA